MTARAATVLAAAALLAGAPGRGLAAAGATGAAALADAPAASPSWVRTARQRLSRLKTRAAGPMAGYSRARFGSAWEDVDLNGCDTRDDILARDLTQVAYKGTSRCTIARGTLRDPYTGKTIGFVRGVGTSARVQIDHVVALADAWRTGAKRWTADRRLFYANDPLVLLAVDGPANEAKGDSDAAGWLPPNTAYDCRYVARQIAVKTKYALWVTPPERTAMTDVLSGC